MNDTHQTRKIYAEFVDQIVQKTTKIPEVQKRKIVLKLNTLVRLKLSEIPLDAYVSLIIGARLSFSTTTTTWHIKRSCSRRTVSKRTAGEKICVHSKNIQFNGLLVGICVHWMLISNVSLQSKMSIVWIVTWNSTNLIEENSMRRIMRTFRAGIICTLNSPANSLLSMRTVWICAWAWVG